MGKYVVQVGAGVAEDLGKTLALLGGQRCKTPEQYKAWSQNLGHDHVLTTFTSYGDVSSYRQAEIIRAMA